MNKEFECQAGDGAKGDAVSSPAAPLQSDDSGEASCACEDCGRAYGAPGFPDLVIPTSSWRQISTDGDESGLLCPSCLIARLEKAGISCEGAFMSGPVISVSKELMWTMRWVENLREQGHGWRCPYCHEFRQQTEEERSDDEPDQQAHTPA